ncbi:GNAT family N-acetyltransferase [Halobacteriovorax sp. ZH4_bin.1]|uniref:GNAT family N-acetyltransferase n=1 Tax=unclassified Halobacteriovorax TaxID=2639665 RepID=UPI0037166CDC
MKIETQRLILAIPSLDRVDDILKFYQDNEAHLAPWDPKKPENFFTREFWKEKTQAAIDEFENGVSVRFNIYLKDSSDLIGMVNFTTLERGPFQNCRVGYKSGESFQSQGYMNEALSRGIEYIFDELNFHRIVANYIPHNKRSGNLLKRLGFEEHGTAKNYLHINGKWQDHVLTSKINPNWN